MENILIVACNQKKANEGLAFAEKSGYPKAVAVHQGAKSFTRKFQAVVIYHKKSTEINLMKDLVRNYSDVPIKISIGEEPYGAAASINVKPFVYGQAAEALEFMNTEWKKLDEVMTQIFKQFDKDSSGFIDVHELKAMSKELSGKSMSNAEIEEIMHDFNRTKDNKITEKQFKQWWASGKQGLSPMMRNLIGAKLSTI